MSSPSFYNQHQSQIATFDEQLELYFSHTDINDLLENRATFIDGLLCELWRNAGCDEEKFSLNAVGGYGRKTLHPYSDIDICILHEEKLSTEEAGKLQDFIAQLWDLGLTIGHSIRSLKQNENECRQDATTATNLLDIRCISGNEKHETLVCESLLSNRLWSDERFFEAKIDELKARHKKQSHQPFKIEPNLKEGPGGLRDIQTLTWLTQKLTGTRCVKTIRRTGFLNGDEYAELIEAQNFIWRVRWALHKVAGRDENRLLLAYQSDVAASLGFGETGTLAIEKMMRQLFRALKRIQEISVMILAFQRDYFKPTSTNKIVTLNNQFEVVDGFITAKNEDTFVNRKEIIAMFRHIAQAEVEICDIEPHTIRLMRQARRRLLGDLQDFEDCRKEFIQILKPAHRTQLAIRLMHRHGILSAYIPQWREIVGQMQFDRFHAYTVDEHTYQTITNVIELTSKQASQRFASLQPIFSTIKDKSALVLAALFHDIAKGRGGDHSELGKLDAVQFCQFHKIKNSETTLVSWLVECHLLMSITAQRMDISDPDVIKTFTRKVKTQARLDALYCLTVADINATNTNLWTEWKASLLEKLYLSTKKALLEGVQNLFTLRDKIKEQKTEATAFLAENANFNEERIRELWKKLPLSFFSHLEVAEICAFTQLLYSKGVDNNFISIMPEPIDGCSCIIIYLDNRAGVFADLFATLASLKVEVKDAQIIQTKYGKVLELVKVVDFDGKAIASTTRASTIEKRLNEKVIEAGANTIEFKGSQMESIEKPIQVEYLPSRKNRTLVSISTTDNPSLMKSICNCFHSLEMTIHSARISTIGDRVDNVFLVSGRSGEALSDNKQQRLVDMLEQRTG